MGLIGPQCVMFIPSTNLPLLRQLSKKMIAEEVGSISIILKEKKNETTKIANIKG